MFAPYKFEPEPKPERPWTEMDERKHQLHEAALASLRRALGQFR